MVKLNPAQGVPALVLDDGSVLTQSMAILEWLDESYPVPALLPEDPIIKARARAAALSIATDIHPVNNLRVIGKLKSMGHSQDDAVAWMNDWMVRGFTAFQRLIEPHTPFCCGDSPGIADLCLVPQLYNARRWGCDLSQFRFSSHSEKSAQGSRLNFSSISRKLPLFVLPILVPAPDDH